MENKNNSTFRLTTPSDREIVLERVFEAPRAPVFNAYTEPNLIPQWWGPRGFTTTVDNMHEERDGKTKVTATALFDTVRDRDGKTKVTATALFDTVRDRDGMLKSGMEEGAAESWDRLAELLRTMTRASTGWTTTSNSHP